MGEPNGHAIRSMIYAADRYPQMHSKDPLTLSILNAFSLGSSHDMTWDGPRLFGLMRRGTTGQGPGARDPLADCGMRPIQKLPAP